MLDKVAPTIMCNMQPMPVSAIPMEFRECEKSPLCSHLKEGNAHQQLRVQQEQNWGKGEAITTKACNYSVFMTKSFSHQGHLPAFEASLNESWCLKLSYKMQDM